MASKQSLAKPATPAQSSAISIKSSTQSPSPANSSTTRNSFLSKSMQSSLKHEVFDMSARYGSYVSGASPSPVIHTSSGQGFLWNRDVFLRDEFYFTGLTGQKQQQSADERVVTHDIILDDEDLMFQ